METLGRTFVRRCLDNQEVRTNHCLASGSAQLTSDILTWWAGINRFGDFLEQFDPWTVDSWNVRNDGWIIKGLSLETLSVWPMGQAESCTGNSYEPDPIFPLL